MIYNFLEKRQPRRSRASCADSKRLEIVLEVVARFLLCFGQLTVNSYFVVFASILHFTDAQANVASVSIMPHLRICANGKSVGTPD